MESFISSLLKKGIRLAAEGANLKIISGASLLTDNDKLILKNNKAAVLDFLQDGKIAIASYSQERLWFLAELGYSTHYHLPLVGRIEGNLNLHALEQSIRLLAERHESLRTSFRNSGTLVYQHIRSSSYVPFQFIDLSGNPDKEQLQKKYIQSEIEVPFALEEAPLIRITLLKLNEQVHLLLINMHHIITDGWSVRILLKELKQAYESICGGFQPDWHPLKLQYSGYAVWQRESLAGPAAEKELRYWEKQLNGFEDLELPLDYTRPAKTTGAGSNYQYSIDTSLSLLLKQRSKERRTTALTYYFAATYLLLNRYSGQSDICFGMPVAGRQQQELEELIGFFVNTLVIRIRSGEQDCTIAQLLQDVHDTIIAAQDHQNLPIEKVLEAIQPERHLSRSPIFQVLLSYTPEVVSQIALGECIVTPEAFESNSSKFDLTFSFSETTDDSINIIVEYATDLFQESTIRQFCERLHQFMKLLAEDGDKKLSEISWLTPEEASQIEEWNDTDYMYPEDKCLHDLLDEAAHRHATSAALRYNNQQLSYNELNEQSNLLGAYLQSKGIMADEVIGICIPRSIEMITGVIGILKSGAAYMPIDIQYPDERIKALTEDSGVTKILTVSSCIDKLRVLVPHEAELVAIDTEAPQINTFKGKLRAIAKADNLAYLLYTSGSTGKPKGVMIEHHSVINHNLAVIEAYGITPADNVLQFSTISFDIFVEEVFPTLLSGATLILMDGDRYTDTDYFKSIVQKENVTLLNLPTAFWNTLAETDFSASNVRQVIIGGEKAEAHIVKKWQQRNPHIPLINTYGPTETTVITLLHKISFVTENNDTIPLGKPIRNIKAYVLDKHLNQLGVGVPGELYLSGAGVARGYWRKEALTTMSFIPNPFIPGTVLYKTGDIVRRMKDGSLAYSGRTDFQVKVRGFRVELGEIENVLLEHPQVKEAVVLAKSWKGSNQLTAFYTAATENDASALTSVLQNEVKQKLPAYMFPSEWVALEQLPLTHNGKIDRKKLLTFTAEHHTDTTYKQPKTANEKALAEVWEEVLGKSPIGLDDNFFELGGHSLLLIQLVNTINTTMNTSVRIMDVMECPTVGLLSERVNSHLSENSSPHLIPFYVHEKTNSKNDINIIIPGMPGLCEGYYELAESLQYTGDVYGLQMKGYANDIPSASVREMASHNLSLIRSLKAEGCINLYAHSYGGTVLYEMLKQLQESGKEISIGTIVLIDSGTLLSLSVSDSGFVQLISRDLLQVLNIPQEAGIELMEKLHTNPELRWSDELLRLVQDRLKTSDHFLTSVQQVMQASLSLTYEYGNMKLPYTVSHLISEESKSWLQAACWNECYERVQVRYTGQNHLSIVRKPDCDKWVHEVLANQFQEASASSLK